MNIHFVCTGNTFRSRLAEAYLKSKNIANLQVSSSGIEAYKNLNGSVCEYTINILNKYKLLHYLSIRWVQTSKENLENQDLVVFMDDTHQSYCLDKLKCKIDNYETWDIPDIGEKLLQKPINTKKINSITNERFTCIKDKVDSLIPILKL